MTEQTKNAEVIIVKMELAKRMLAGEVLVSIDYLVSGKEGIITDVIPAIKADKRLRLKAKKALIALVEELCESTVSEKD